MAKKLCACQQEKRDRYNLRRANVRDPKSLYNTVKKQIGKKKLDAEGQARLDSLKEWPRFKLSKKAVGCMASWDGNDD